jgi:hypothetical protein
MLAVHDVEFPKLGNWPILFCDLHYRILWGHTYHLPVSFGVVHDIVHLPPHPLVVSTVSNERSCEGKINEPILVREIDEEHIKNKNEEQSIFERSGG